MNDAIMLFCFVSFVVAILFLLAAVEAHFMPAAPAPPAPAPVPPPKPEVSPANIAEVDRFFATGETDGSLHEIFG